MNGDIEVLDIYIYANCLVFVSLIYHCLHIGYCHILYHWYPTGGFHPTDLGLGEKLHPWLLLGYPAGEFFFHEYGYEEAKPDRFSPVAIPTPYRDKV